MTIIRRLAELEETYRAIRLLLPKIDFSDATGWTEWCDSLTTEVREDLTRLTVTLNSLVRRHVLIPVGIASRHSRLPHKIHGLLHSLMVDVGRWSSVHQLTSSLTSACTDQGVESNLASAPVTLTELDAKGSLPKMCTSSAHDDVAAQHGHGLLAAADARDSGTWAVRQLMAECMWVPGPLHVVHNAMELILSSMGGSDRFLRQVQTITGFLKYKGLRELFCQTCLTGPNI